MIELGKEEVKISYSVASFVAGLEEDLIKLRSQRVKLGSMNRMVETGRNLGCRERNLVNATKALRSLVKK